MRGAHGVACVIALALSSASALAQEWNGPLFGLATAPNGDILVTDAGAGVVVLGGKGPAFPPVPGITDVAAVGRGTAWVSRNGTNPEEDTGQAVLKVSRGGVEVVANLFHFEETYNPHTAKVESNPFDVFALNGGHVVVADAAGNDLLHVDDEGNVEVLAIFPSTLVTTASLKNAAGCPDSEAPVCGLPPMMPAEAVPTSVVRGPDGWFYVGELRGFPGPLGQSRVWRVSPWASWAECGASDDCELVFDGGFTSIIDLGMGPDGLLYVAEFDENGWFLAEVLGAGVGGQIRACDLDSLVCAVVANGIPFLTAMTFGKDGRLWSTRNAIIPPLASVEVVE